MKLREWVIAAYACLMGLWIAVGWMSLFPDFFSEQSWFYKWQTLETGVFALIAAGITAAVVLHQTHVTASAERTKQRNREIATRARLPYILDEVIDYAERSIKTLTEMHNHREKGRVIAGMSFTEPAPELSNTVIAQLADALEHGGAPPRDMLAALLNGLQLQNARFTRDTRAVSDANSSFIVTGLNVDSRAMGAAAIYAMAAALYPYGRRDTEAVASMVTQADVYKSLSNLKYEPAWDEDFIKRFLTGKETNVWSWKQ